MERRTASQTTCMVFLDDVSTEPRPTNSKDSGFRSNSLYLNWSLWWRVTTPTSSAPPAVAGGNKLTTLNDEI